jgi:hypothetical protein
MRASLHALRRRLRRPFLTPPDGRMSVSQKAVLPSVVIRTTCYSWLQGSLGQDAHAAASIHFPSR